MNLTVSTQRCYSLCAIVLLTLLLTACNDADSITADQPPQVPPAASNTGSLTTADKTAEPADASRMVASTTASGEQYQTIEWTDLMPEDDLEALTNPPEYLSEIEDGAPEDTIGGRLKNDTAGGVSEDRYQQALVSRNIVEAFNKQAVRLPGFIVPLETNDEQKVTEFFLVPFFGACIHLPPPPPNQIVFVQYDQGIQVDSIYHPFWVSGELQTSLTENDVAVSAYAIKADQIELYQYQ